MQYMVLNGEHVQDVEHYHLIGISNKIEINCIDYKFKPINSLWNISACKPI